MILYKNKYYHDRTKPGKTFEEVVDWGLRDYDGYSGGQLEALERQIKILQGVVTFLTLRLSEEDKRELADTFRFEPITSEEEL